MSGKKRHPSGKKKPAKKNPGLLTRRAVLAVGCCVILALCVAAAVLLLRANQMLPVANVGGHTVGQAELQYYYVEAITDYQEQVSRYGDDYDAGIDFDRPLSQQSCPLTSGISWHTYFLQRALSSIQREVAAQQEALESGFTLSQAQQSAAALRMDHLESVAAEAGMSLEEYLLERYGKNVTEDLVSELLERQSLSTFYLASLEDGYTPSEEEVEAYFQENRKWNMLADYWAVALDSPAEEQEQILADLASSQDETDFLARCQAYTEKSAEDSAVKHTGAASGDMEDYTVAEWLLDDSRQAGDVTVVESYDEMANQKSLIALYFLDAGRNDHPTYQYQEILLMPETIHPGDTARYWGEKQAQAISKLSDQEAFGAAAAMFSSLSSSQRLGLQTASAEELSDQPYALWLTDENRTEGEIATFETDGGVYLIRYVGQGGAYWESNAYNALLSQWESQWEETAAEAAAVHTNLFYLLIR